MHGSSIATTLGLEPAFVAESQNLVVPYCRKFCCILTSFLIIMEFRPDNMTNETKIEQCFLLPTVSHLSMIIWANVAKLYDF